MTNFQVEQLTSSKWLTPERYAIYLPSFIGAGVSILIVSFALIPMIWGIRERWDDVVVMEAKVNELPLLRRQLSLNQAKLEQLKYQETLLLDLIASKDELKTYLAQLNNLVSIHKLSLVELKPDDIETYLPSMSLEGESSLSKSNPESSDSDDLEVRQDPLLVSGIEKHSMNLVVEGSFVNLLDLLRDLESLNIIMIPSALRLDQASKNPGDPSTSLGRLQMSLILSGYGRSSL